MRVCMCVCVCVCVLEERVHSMTVFLKDNIISQDKYKYGYFFNIYGLVSTKNWPFKGLSLSLSLSLSLFILPCPQVSFPPKNTR